MVRLLFLAALLCMGTVAHAEDDEHEFFGFSASKPGVAPVDNALYSKSCGECHFAYQPGLLPKRSWAKMMEPKELANHFGDNAELTEGDRQLVLAYLSANAADHSEFKRSQKMMRSIRDDEAPLRISEVTYFKRKHHEIPSRMVAGNPQVKSLSNCAACHTTADKGSYSEHGVRIPGYGRWED